MKAIVYPYDGHLAVTLGVADADAEQMALLVTPINVPFLILEQSEVPEDQTYFNAWTADFSYPSGVGIGREAYDQLYPTHEDADVPPAHYQPPPQPSEQTPDEE